MSKQNGKAVKVTKVTKEKATATEHKTRGPSVEVGGVKLTPNQVRVLKVMKDGKERGASGLAEATGIVKGKRIPQLVEAGFLREKLVEGVRGKQYTITPSGKKALEKVSK